MSSQRFARLAVAAVAMVGVGCGSLGYRSVDKATFERAKKGQTALRDEAESMRSEAARAADAEAAARSASDPELAARQAARQVELQATSTRLDEAADSLEGGENLAQLGLYFSVEPLVAFDSDLDATAIPALGVNWRPWEETALAVQGLFGGAINPSSGGDDVGAALGLGFSHPVSENGAISFGHIWWNEDGDGDNGWYVGINLGNFTIPADDATD
jgi:hypothetical protein